VNVVRAIEMIMKHRLYINGGPMPRGGSHFVVSEAPVDAFRGSGLSIEAAVQDWARQKWPVGESLDATRQTTG
jgi:hypothetical protein